MATKRLKSIEVGLIGCGDAVTLNASDTATEPIATYALDEFKAEDQMSFKDNGKEYFVPFHAVDHIYESESDTEVADRPNPYGCEPSGGGTDPSISSWTLLVGVDGEPPTYDGDFENAGQANYPVGRYVHESRPDETSPANAWYVGEPTGEYAYQYSEIYEEDGELMAWYGECNQEKLEGVFDFDAKTVAFERHSCE